MSKRKASDYPPCANCGHPVDLHDPCSQCAIEGRQPCRNYTDTRTRQPTRRGSMKQQIKKKSRRGR